MQEEITIHTPIALPGQFMWCQNYRSTRKPFVLVYVNSVKTGWNADKTYRHSFDCVRVNSTNLEIGKYSNTPEYYRGKKGHLVFLYVNEAQLMTL